jgi:hypothetical protein
LILNVEVDRGALVHAIDEIYRAELSAGSSDHALDQARAMAQCIEHFARTDPQRIEVASERVARYQERLRELHIRDQTVREMLPAEGRIRERTRLVLLGLAGLIPALVGGAVHYLPYRVTAAVGRLAGDPTRVASYRIGAAVVVFPLVYAALAWWLTGGLSWPLPIALAALAATAALGLHALLYFNWLSRQGQRIRLVILKASQRQRVARLRRERRGLIQMCEASKREYLAAVGRNP